MQKENHFRDSLLCVGIVPHKTEFYGVPCHFIDFRQVNCPEIGADLSAVIGRCHENKKEDCQSNLLIECRHLPIFPVRRQTSIFGACELNYCVRNGNRWTLAAINTYYLICDRHIEN